MPLLSTKSVPGFPTLYVMAVIVVSDSKVIVFFIDIGAIVDHHGLYFLFIITPRIESLNIKMIID